MTTEAEFSTAMELDDDDWSDSVPHGTLHRNPDQDGRLPCCGGDALSVASGEGWTSDPARADCAGRAL